MVAGGHSPPGMDIARRKTSHRHPYRYIPIRPIFRAPPRWGCTRLFPFGPSGRKRQKRNQNVEQ